LIKQPIVAISCAVFRGLLDNLLPRDRVDRIHFLDYTLHQVPKKLRSAVQDAIDKLRKPSLIVLGYGLCGKGLDNIQAGKHTLIMPRCDDCIAVLLGSRDERRKRFNSEPGTYYLTKGWIESGSEPLKECEAMMAQFGVQKGEWIMDQQYRHYRRLTLVAHSRDELDAYRPRARQIAKYCERWGMAYEELLGSDGYIRRLITSIDHLTASNEDFLLVEPGGAIRQQDFIRLDHEGR
jgi:hypothetical protein